VGLVDYQYVTFIGTLVPVHVAPTRLAVVSACFVEAITKGKEMNQPTHNPTASLHNLKNVC
jgi:hypothetical protein